ncbi:hypothetical protein [Pseudomonas sp. FG-3G]|nr:hypothetical protein [Pseudomonas sp. FG-3G]
MHVITEKRIWEAKEKMAALRQFAGSMVSACQTHQPG